MSSDLKEQLKQIVFELENLSIETQNINERKKEIEKYAKKAGIDTKIVKKVMQIRKKPPQERDNEEMLLHSYLSMLESGSIK